MLLALTPTAGCRRTVLSWSVVVQRHRNVLVHAVPSAGRGVDYANAADSEKRKVATTSMEVRKSDLFRCPKVNRAILPVLRRARPASSSKPQARNHATMRNRKLQLCV